MSISPPLLAVVDEYKQAKPLLLSSVVIVTVTCALPSLGRDCPPYNRYKSTAMTIQEYSRASNVYVPHALILKLEIMRTHDWVRRTTFYIPGLDEKNNFLYTWFLTI